MGAGLAGSTMNNVNVNQFQIGEKLQGLPPQATGYYKAKYTGRDYSTRSGDGSNRNMIFCINRLGGVGRGRSQFNIGGINLPDGTRPCTVYNDKNNNNRINNWNNLDTIQNSEITTDNVEYFKVVVKNDENGNLYDILDSVGNSVFQEGNIELLIYNNTIKLVFDISDSSLVSHPIGFSLFKDGTWNDKPELTNGVIIQGEFGSDGSIIEINIIPETILYFFCRRHPNMGRENYIKISSNDPSYYTPQ